MNEPRLKLLQLVEVDEMVEPYQRYMSMNITNDMIQELIDMYEDGGQINRSSIARTVGRSMSLSDHCTTPTINRKQEQLNIRRFRFFLHVIDTEAERNRPGKSFLITGFTDQIGDEDLDDLDPRCLMYVNAIVELRSSLERDRRGDRYERFSISKMMVVHRRDHASRRHHNGRVTDVLTLCSLAEAGEIDIRENGDHDRNTLATSTLFTKRGVRGASMSDMTRNNYLHRLINADRSGMADSRTYSDNEYDDDDEGQGTRRYNAAAGQYSDTPEIDRGNTFIHWMRTRSQTMSTEMTFEYQDLIDLVDVRNPNYDDLCENTEIAALADVDITYVSKEFYGKSSKMRSVAIMSQEIPAMMSECLLSRITFTIDNRHLDRDGLPEYSIDDYSTVVNIEGVDEMLDVFMRRYINEVYLVATNDNDRYMNLHINCNFGGQVEIEMSYENEDEEEFRFPAFMSGILSNNASFDLKETYRLADSYTSISKDFVERTVFGETDRDGEQDSGRLDKMMKAFRD